MYRAYLRPPWPLFQTAAGLLTPLVIWGAIAVWSHEQSELERLYLGDYLRVTLMPDLSSVTKLLAFGPIVLDLMKGAAELAESTDYKS